VKNANLRKLVLDVLVPFMRRTGMSATRLSYLSLSDPTFVGEFLRGDRDPRLSTVEKLLTFMKRHKAAGPSARLRAKPKAGRGK
jgi:hypothetical protein